MLVSGGALKPNATASAKPVKKWNKKSLLAGKSPRLNYVTKSSLVFEDHFIDCVPFYMIETKNVVAVISLTEWLVKEPRIQEFHSSRICKTAGRRRKTNAEFSCKLVSALNGRERPASV